VDIPCSEEHRSKNVFNQRNATTESHRNANRNARDMLHSRTLALTSCTVCLLTRQNLCISLQKGSTS